MNLWLGLPTALVEIWQFITLAFNLIRVRTPLPRGKSLQWYWLCAVDGSRGHAICNYLVIYLFSTSMDLRWQCRGVLEGHVRTGPAYESYLSCPRQRDVKHQHMIKDQQSRVSIRHILLPLPPTSRQTIKNLDYSREYAGAHEKQQFYFVEYTQ